MSSDIHLTHVIGHSSYPCHRTFISSMLTHLIHIIVDASHPYHRRRISSISSLMHLIINIISITQGISRSRMQGTGQRQRLLFMSTASKVTINCHPSKSHPSINVSPHQRHQRSRIVRARLQPLSDARHVLSLLFVSQGGAFYAR